ncbi:hypothetical protein [Apilactobacillus xinyiensis]|uniref:Uncharacterized protein n=1 Tax=Apilactobacillus xinyiensis TaxID=2841032 RepID=A0ABT0HZF8_9LACO|nr:hypothetical protein [Apilactobacillus xinyiensis]MCK8623963.1 hypothetical protein [Apilactobacillus xinyiensis]MCL0311555.1 hypothetical protein [Apilactobacillus xinyiensis]MCL0318300.1 hypothetical protein [Apilactobacillus xinyiensis]
MSSNSDTISNILFYIRQHPEKTIFKSGQYKNSIQMFINDDIKIGNTNLFFPKGRLRVNRMNNDFMENNNDLINYFYSLTDDENNNFKEIWVTTGHIVDHHKFIIDLSFE